jgi:ATP-dependent Clp protease ATP-binding subunit ClpA
LPSGPFFCHDERKESELLMMTRELERRLAEAAEMAKQSRHEFVTLEHILLSICSSPVTVEILNSLNVQVPELKKIIRDYLLKIPTISTEQIDTYGGFEAWQPEFTLACHRLFQRAALQVKSAGKNQINEGTLLVALFYEQDSHAVYSLSQLGVSQFDVIQFISHGTESDLPVITSQSNAGHGEEKSSSSQNPLDQFCVNLTQKARDGKLDPVVGREFQLNRMIQVLARRSKNNPLLIGEPGVGKTALVEGLAQRIVEGQVPDLLSSREIYSLDLGSMLAGSKFRGDFEGRLKGVLKEVQKRKNVILFIDEIHTIVGAGATSGGSMDASNLLKPFLGNGDLPVIGSTTQTEFRQHFEKDRALNRRFQKISVEEPSRHEALEILKGLKKHYEKHHEVEYTNSALEAALDLSQKHISSGHWPDKAIDVIDEAGAFMRLENRSEEVIIITEKEIERTLARMTGLPVAQISSSEKAQLKDLDKKLKALIFGQDKAIEQVVASIKMARAGLKPSTKPVGCFLFAGPTGVGKTEVAKQLAEQLSVPFVRFDMGEYMEKHSVARLMGAPPGYVGFESGGLLTETINQKPFCVLLLDEIEKAHPDISQALLQVMDAARMTDGQGRVADFKNVILIMTTNAGADSLSKGTIGLVDSSRSALSLDIIKKSFSPEFINRLDGVVGFNDLSSEIILKVAQKSIDELKMALISQNVELQITAGALERLAQLGYDKAYGARPMQRAVNEHIKKPLSDELLFGKLSQGGIVLVEENSAKGFKFDFKSSASRGNGGGSKLVPVKTTKNSKKKKESETT